MKNAIVILKNAASDIGLFKAGIVPLILLCIASCQVRADQVPCGVRSSERVVVLELPSLSENRRRIKRVYDMGRHMEGEMLDVCDPKGVGRERK